jgi:pimeloyl-ACP methyl ester carboxylesterase
MRKQLPFDFPCAGFGLNRRQVLRLLSPTTLAAGLLAAGHRHPAGAAQSETPNAPKSFFRNINGVNIHYRQWGNESNRPMLLLHPAPLNSHVWNSFGPAMASRFRVIAPDARGFGESNWSDSYDGDIFLEDLCSLVNDLGLRRVVLCGNSMGGTLAYMYAGQYPDNVERLILVDTGPGEKPSDAGPPPNASASPRRPGPPPIPPGPFTSADDAAAQVPKLFGPAFIKAMIEHNLKRCADGSWCWKFDHKGTAPAAERAMRDLRKWPLWRSVKCPTLVLRGERSPAMSQQSAEQMVAENERATLVVIPNAGHFIPLEAPSALEAAVRKWLAL